MITASKTYFVTGASRGIGAALVKQIRAADANSRVIASLRDLNTPAAKELSNQNGVTLVKIDAADDEAPFEAAKELVAKGIERIDVLYACHGYHPPLQSLMDIKAKTLRDVLNVNAVSVLSLFRALKPLLERSSSPKFVIIASASGSLTLQHTFEAPGTAYAVSKVALHMIARRIHTENPWLTTFALRPGRVATELTLSVFGANAMEEQLKAGKAITTEQSAKLVVEFVEASTHEEHAGNFFNAYDGKSLPW